jgi:hypothetical protein
LEKEKAGIVPIAMDFEFDSAILGNACGKYGGEYGNTNMVILVYFPNL